MIRCGKKSKILAAVVAAGIILSMQGMTALAGSTGVGAAKSAQTGPGVAAQTDSQTAQPEEQAARPEARRLNRKARSLSRRSRQLSRKARQYSRSRDRNPSR